jgi:hypothetical protein
MEVVRQGYDAQSKPPLTLATFLRDSFGRTIVANLVGLVVLVIGFLTDSALVYLGLAILIGSLAVRIFVVATARYRRGTAPADPA